MTLPSAAAVIDFDPLDPALRFADYPVYDEIRRAGGISWSGAHGGFSAVADFALVKDIASDNVRFRSGEGVRIPPNGTPPRFALEYDRPRHTTHRAILTEGVGPRVAPGLADSVRAAARALLPAGPAPAPSTWGRATRSSSRWTWCST
jgi:cytochrome P450